MMASLGNFKTLKISDARKNRRRTISEIDNFKNGLVSAVSIYWFISCLVGQNWPHPKGHKLEHRNLENQLQNSSSLKLEGVQLWFWYVASPCGPLSILFI